MTESETIFLDTAPIIYFLDKDINFGEKARAVIEMLLNSGMTSNCGNSKS